MPILVGFFNPISRTPAFLIPLFVHKYESNRVFIQRIALSGQIESFIEFDVEVQNVAISDIERAVGDEALWAFEDENGDRLCASRSELINTLSHALTGGHFTKYPWLEGEVAVFCSDCNAAARSFAKSFEQLKLHSTTAAGIWRDAVIILPTLKRELAASLPPALLAQKRLVANIRAVGRGTRLYVEVPQGLAGLTNIPDIADRLKETTLLSIAFNMPEIRFTTLKELQTIDEPRAALPLPSGAVEGFSATGAKVAGQSPSGPRRSKRVLPMGISPLDRRRLLSTEPLLAFAVMNSSPGQIEAAIYSAGRWLLSPIKVAIVMRPIGFGTPRSGNLDIFALEALHGTFDYIFIIGNHTLSKPEGQLPYLAASHHGITFARAAINAMVQLVWATSANVSSIRKLLPTKGFCLVGRAASIDDTLSHSKHLQRALGTMLHENLPLENARQLVVLDASNHIHTRSLQSEFMKFAGPLASSSLPSFLPIRAPVRSSKIVSLAFGVEPNEITQSSFGSFCRRLLPSAGWKPESDPTEGPIILARRGRLRAIFGSLTRADNPDSLLQSLIRAQGRDFRLFIVTNFTPSRQFVARARGGGVIVKHYSMLGWDRHTHQSRVNSMSTSST